MQQQTTHAPREDGPRPPVLRPAALGTAVGVVAVLAVFGLAQLAGNDLMVAPPGQEAAAVPVGAAVTATVFAGLLALVLALVVRRSHHARTWFVAIGTAALVVSFVSVTAAESTATAWWLAAMHVAAAAGIVPVMARALPGGRA